MLSRAMVVKGLAAIGFGAFASAASADFIATIEGNACPGAFGDNFGDCVIPDQYDPLDRQTPVIIKFNVGGATEINSALFPTIDGSEFIINFTTDGTGTWTYNPGPGDPVINFYAAKGGPDFNLFSNLGDPNSDIWFTPTNPANSTPFALSNLSFYDTEGDQGPGPKVPEPTTMLLLGAGLLAVGLVRRRRRD